MSQCYISPVMSSKESYQFGVTLIDGIRPVTALGTSAAVIQCLLTYPEGVNVGTLIEYIEPEKKSISQNRLTQALKEASQLLSTNNYYADITNTEINGKKGFILSNRLIYSDPVVSPAQEVSVSQEIEPKLSLDKIVSTVSDVAEVPEDQIVGSNKHKDLSQARILISYFANQRYQYDLQEIGRRVKKNHTTIAYHVNAARERIEKKDKGDDFYLFYQDLCLIFDAIDQGKEPNLG